MPKVKKLYIIGSDLPDEYSGSNYTAKLKGTLAKAKANATQGIPEIIEIAGNRRFRENLERKFHAELVIRHSEDRKLYLYDIINIKKETSTPFEL